MGRIIIPFMMHSGISTYFTAGFSRLCRLSREGSWVVMGQAATVIGSLAGVRLLSELLDPAAYGELALGMTAAALVNQTILGPLSNGIARFYALAAEQGNLRDYLDASRRLVLLATGGIALLGMLFISGLILSGTTGRIVALALASLAFATLSGLNAILNGIQNATRRRALVAARQGIESWGRFLIATAMLLWLSRSSEVAMAGFAIAAAVVLASQFTNFSGIHVPPAAETDGKSSFWRKKIWTFSWPFSTFGIFTLLQSTSDRWALQLFSTAQAVGLYAVLFQVGYYPITIGAGIAVQFFSPIFYQKAGDGTDGERNADVLRLCGRLVWTILMGTIVVFAAAIFWQAPIMRFFTAEEYRSASHLLPWLLLSGGMFAAGQVVEMTLMSQARTRLLIPAKVATAVCGVILNFAGAYWYGIPGIVAAVNLFSLSYLLSMALLLKRHGTGRVLCLS